MGSLYIQENIAVSLIMIEWHYFFNLNQCRILMINSKISSYSSLKSYEEKKVEECDQHAWVIVDHMRLLNNKTPPSDTEEDLGNNGWLKLSSTWLSLGPDIYSYSSYLRCLLSGNGLIPFRKRWRLMSTYWLQCN